MIRTVGEAITVNHTEIIKQRQLMRQRIRATVAARKIAAATAAAEAQDPAQRRLEEAA